MRGAGQFVFWDCAGHSEYSITHGMFLGASQSIFVVVYDLEKVSLEISVCNLIHMLLFILYTLLVFKNIDMNMLYTLMVFKNIDMNSI